MRRATVFWLSAAVLFVAPLQAGQSNLDDEVGTVSKIRLEYETSTTGENGSSGSSKGHQTVVERVIGKSQDGLTLEYDLPSDATAEARERQWQFPARVLKRPDGSVQLLNEGELNVRVDAWLASAGWTREVCGRWNFTWNAFRIECDPQTVVEAIGQYDLRPADLREGGGFTTKMAIEPGIFRMTESDGGANLYVAEMAVDPAKLRHAEAESAVVVAEIMREELSLDDALAARADNAASGTISVTFETEAAGRVLRRTTQTELVIEGADGDVERRSSTETVRRVPLDL